MAFLFQDQNQGTRNNGAHAKSREAPQPFSFIRTLTVGLGIAPNLLTLFPGEKKYPGEPGARGLGLLHPYRRWGLSPRPENIGCPIWATCGELCRVAPVRASTFGMGNQHVPMPPDQAWAAARPALKS